MSKLTMALVTASGLSTLLDTTVAIVALTASLLVHTAVMAARFGQLTQAVEDVKGRVGRIEVRIDKHFDK